jgi:hypothetical protein
MSVCLKKEYLFIPLQAYLRLFIILRKNTYSLLCRITGNIFELLEVLQDAPKASLKKTVIIAKRKNKAYVS